MAYVVTIPSQTPPARYDDVSWVNVRVFEGTTADGPWVQIDDIPIPSFSDPSAPDSVSITTTNATADVGLWYRVAFIDGNNNQSAMTAPWYNESSTYTNYRPTVKDVADHIRARTIDEFDNEVGTFTNATTPNAAAVEDLINDALDEVSSVYGASIPDAPAPNPELYRVAAANVVATLAAAKVELTHFGKEVARQNSPYEQLMKEFDRSLLWLSAKLGVAVPGGDTGGGTAEPTGSHYAIWGNDVEDPYTDMMTRPT